MIQHKKKICKSCKKEVYIFSKGRCKYCTAKETLNSAEKKTKAKKVTGEKELFEKIWKSRPHRCFVTGKKIAYPTASVFAHVLSKAQNKFPDYKLNPDNIVLLLPEVHRLYDFGSKEQRENYGYSEGWARLYEKREHLIQTYKTLEYDRNIGNDIPTYTSKI